MDITIKMKDGTVRDFKERGRAGGSWTQNLKYDGCFAIVVDEWGNQTAIPAADISEIKTNSNGRGGY